MPNGEKVMVVMDPVCRGFSLNCNVQLVLEAFHQMPSSTPEPSYRDNSTPPYVEKLLQSDSSDPRNDEIDESWQRGILLEEEEEHSAVSFPTPENPFQRIRSSFLE